MPLYEYICQECGIRFEALRSMKEADDQIPCKRCKSFDTKRALSVFYASSDGKAISGSGGGCNCTSCNGGNCASCSH